MLIVPWKHFVSQHLLTRNLCPRIADTGGSNRFRPPQTLHDTWDDTRPAVNYSAACPDYFLDGLNYGLSENCLTINVVRPAGLAHDEILPVVFWIHGGS